MFTNLALVIDQLTDANQILNFYIFSVANIAKQCPGINFFTHGKI